MLLLVGRGRRGEARQGMQEQLEEAAFRPGSKCGAESSPAALVGLCTCTGGQRGVCSCFF